MKPLLIIATLLCTAVAGCANTTPPANARTPDCLITDKQVARLCAAPELARCTSVATVEQHLDAVCVIRP